MTHMTHGAATFHSLARPTTAQRNLRPGSKPSWLQRTARPLRPPASALMPPTAPVNHPAAKHPSPGPSPRPTSAPGSTPALVAGAPALPLPKSSSRRILFLDSRVDNPATVIGCAVGHVPIVLLDAHCDGIMQMAAHLRGRNRLETIFIAAADGTGALSLGNAHLSIRTLFAYEDALRDIGSALGPEGRIQLLGRSPNSNGRDSTLLLMLGRLTGATVEASPEPAWAAHWDSPEHRGKGPDARWPRHDAPGRLIIETRTPEVRIAGERRPGGVKPAAASCPG